MDKSDFEDIVVATRTANYSAPEVISGISVPAVRRISIFSPEEWEEFTEEWAYSLRDKFIKVQRYGGAGDMGCDVVGFQSKQYLKGPWVNYQCKHYDNPLIPSKSWVELGKVIYYSFLGEYIPPIEYYFVAPKGIGTSFSKLLTDPKKLKAELIKNWDKACQKKITETKDVFLNGDFLSYLNCFDFGIFDSISVAELVQGHAKTPFHATRFGGGLAERPPVDSPPQHIAFKEHRYSEQLFEAYTDFTQLRVTEIQDLDNEPRLKRHFSRSRERFYHAEALRNFARDNVPPGTFEALQDEVFHGVIDTCDGEHQNGFVRVNATVSQASQLSITGNALCSRMQVHDKQGICHQLANEDRLTWVDKND